ncbi:MAG: STAS domain-containing protein [Terriglobales bacterium]
MILEITKKPMSNDVVVLEMVGRITLGRDCEQIEQQVNELIREKQTKVIFELSRVKHMDSTGIGILVLCSGKLKDAGGELRLAGATGVVEQTLRLTRMNRIVPTFATVAEATAGFAKAARA